MEKLYDVWARRTPKWETKFQEPIIEEFTNYRYGSGASAERRAKVYGGGYEIFIIAFFIGLYSRQTRALNENPDKVTDFGQPIQYWGNVGDRGKRREYSKLREYMFAALIARTDIDFLALDKGEITLRKAVDILISKMEEYANYGFYVLNDVQEETPGYFFQNDAFFKVINRIVSPETTDTNEEIVPPPLD